MTAPTTTAPAEAVPTVEATAQESVQAGVPEVVEQDLLVEDVSIDGMCGVY